MESVSRVRVPHPALRAYVESYTGYRHLIAPGIHHGLPSHSLTLVIAFQEPVDLAWAGAPGTRERFWVASGLHSRPALIHHDGFQYGVQVSLTPLGARALFGIPAAGLARDMVTLDDLPAPLPPLQELLADAPTWPARFDALDEAFLRALARHDAAPPAAEVSQAWWVLHRTHGRARVGDVAAEVGWSRRHLGQRFVDEFGITPKEAARIFRFQHSRRLVTGGCRLAHAAALAGYADQAHLTREWRALAGYAPTEYLREELPFLQDDEDVPVGRSSA